MSRVKADEDSVNTASSGRRSSAAQWCTVTQPLLVTNSPPSGRGGISGCLRMRELADCDWLTRSFDEELNDEDDEEENSECELPAAALDCRAESDNTDAPGP